MGEKDEEEEDQSRDGWHASVNRNMRAIGTIKDEVHARAGWMRIVSTAVTPQ